MKALAAAVLFCPLFSAVTLYAVGWPRAALFNLMVEIAAIILVVKHWKEM
jgi:hypothetical protein